MRINPNVSTNLNDITSRFVQLQKQRQAARQTTNAVSFAQSPPVAQNVSASLARKADTVDLSRPTPAAATPAAQAVASQAQTDPQVQKAKIEAALTTTLAPKQEQKPVEPATEGPQAVASTTPTFTADDVNALRNAFGKNTGDEGFNAQYDLNGDGTINTLDLVRILGAVR